MTRRERMAELAHELERLRIEETVERAMSDVHVRCGKPCLAAMNAGPCTCGCEPAPGTPAAPKNAKGTP